jgi:hypothetical protein
MENDRREGTHSHTGYQTLTTQYHRRRRSPSRLLTDDNASLLLERATLISPKKQPPRKTHRSGLVKPTSKEAMGMTRADEGLQDWTTIMHVIVATRRSRQQLQPYSSGWPTRKQVGQLEQKKPTYKVLPHTFLTSGAGVILKVAHLAYKDIGRTIAGKVGVMPSKHGFTFLW